MDPNKFQEHFTEGKFWEKVTKFAKTAGSKVIYTGLLLYFAFRQKGTPNWAKHIITGALGYLISPIDALPDLTPLIGYTDDMGVLMFALVTISAYINDEVKKEAREQMVKWFGEVDQEAINEVEERL